MNTHLSVCLSLSFHLFTNDFLILYHGPRPVLCFKRYRQTCPWDQRAQQQRGTVSSTGAIAAEVCHCRGVECADTEESNMAVLEIGGNFSKAVMLKLTPEEWVQAPEPTFA